MRPPRFFIDTGPLTPPHLVDALQRGYAAEVLPLPTPTSTWVSGVWRPLLGFLLGHPARVPDKLARERLLIAAALKRQARGLAGEDALRLADRLKPVRSAMRGPGRII